MNASRRSSSRRVSAASARRYRTRPMAETLELRQLIASVDWISKSTATRTRPATGVRILARTRQQPGTVLAAIDALLESNELTGSYKVQW
jgi:hypothetical protein